MNRDALGAARAQHRNNMDQFNLLHDLSPSVGRGISPTRTAREPRGSQFKIPGRETILKAVMRAEGVVELQQDRGHDSASAAFAPCFRIARLAGRRRTT